MRGARRLVALPARKRFAKLRCAAFGSDDPGAIHPGRVVPNVLLVTALELGDPVAEFVLVIADNASVQRFPQNRYPACTYQNMPGTSYVDAS